MSGIFGDAAAKPATTAAPYLRLSAVILGITVFQLGNGVLQTYLPIRLIVEHYPDIAVGLMATTHSIGFLVCCLIAPRIIHSIGHIRAFAAFSGAMAAIALAFAGWVDPVPWVILRLVTGFCSGGVFTVIESWLNDGASTRERGRILSIYMVSVKLSYAAGQLLLTTGDPHSFAFFMIASAAYSVCLIPVSATRASSPMMVGTKRMGIAEVYRTTPAAAIGCFAAGLVTSAVVNIGPAYGTEINIATGDIAILMAAMQIGGLVMQWPLGALSDRIDRRWVMAGASGAVALVSLVVATNTGWSTWILALLLALWGGFALSLYALAIAHANDFADKDQTVSLASTLLMIWALGSVIGPLLATSVMAQVGPAGLFLYSAIVSLILAGFVLWRRTRRAAVPAEQRAPYAYAPTTSPIANKLRPPGA
ncbi:MAG TPA: MFS transporter [Stellaceae bacterium]|nr:MFS transporter [Stellaceae bacterium]